MKKSLKIMMGLLAVLIVTLAASFLAPDNAAEGIMGIAIAAPLVIGFIENSTDARQERGKVWDAMQTMIESRKKEKRNFTPEEETQFEEYRKQFDDLTKKIETLEADEKRALQMAGLEAERRNRQNSHQKDVARYSIKRAISSQLKNGAPLNGIEKEMHDEAVKEARESNINITGIGIPTMVLDHIQEKRALTATGQTSTAGDQGGMAIVTEKQGLIEALRPLLVLSSLGVKTMGGLVGNIDLVKGTSTAAAWETENGDNDETTPTISKSSFSPKRLGAFTKISKQLLLQSDINFETFVMMDLYAAIAQAVETAAISGASGGNNPVGILATSGIGSVAGGTDGLAMAWSHLTALEKEVAIDNALKGTLGYLTNHKVKNALKNTKIDSGSGLFVWPQNANELNGYPVAVSNLVPSNLTKGTGTNLSAAIFGNWGDMVIGQWGGIDMLVDEITLHGAGQIKISTNSYWDVFVKRAESFAAMVDIIAS